jgi:hypothetical protein
LHWPPGFALDDDGAIADTSGEADILDFNGDEIAGAQFAIDRQIEQGEVSWFARHFESDTDRPDLLWFQRSFLTPKLAISALAISLGFDLYRHGCVSCRPRLLGIRLRTSH